MSGSEIGAFLPDNLLAGSLHIVTRPATIEENAGNLVRGQVMGKITKGAVTQSFSGTGNGTLTLDPTEPRLSHSIPGTYKVVFTGATAYKVYDPSGNLIDTVAALGAFANKLKFTIAAGATAFVAGDTFSIIVAAGSGYLAAFDSSAVDGTEKPYAILEEDAPASTSTQDAPMALSGEFTEDLLVFSNANDSFAEIADELRAIGIYGKPASGGD